MMCFLGSNISVASFGFSVKQSKLCSLAQTIKEMKEEEFQRRLEQVRLAREWYTYNGTLRQLEMFFSDPLGPSGGQLRCTKVPIRDHRKF